MTQHQYYPMPYRPDQFNIDFKKGGVKAYIIVAYTPLARLEPQRNNTQEPHPPSPSGIKGMWTDFRQSIINTFLDRQSRNGKIKSKHTSLDAFNRMGYGAEILPFPAWIDRRATQDYLYNSQKRFNIFRNSFILEVEHQDIQKIIDQKRYGHLRQTRQRVISAYNKMLVEEYEGDISKSPQSFQTAYQDTCKKIKTYHLYLMD